MQIARPIIRNQAIGEKATNVLNGFQKCLRIVGIARIEGHVGHHDGRFALRHQYTRHDTSSDRLILQSLRFFAEVATGIERFLKNERGGRGTRDEQCQRCQWMELSERRLPPRQAWYPRPD